MNYSMNKYNLYIDILKNKAKQQNKVLAKINSASDIEPGYVGL